MMQEISSISNDSERRSDDDNDFFFLSGSKGAGVMFSISKYLDT